MLKDAAYASKVSPLNFRLVVRKEGSIGTDDFGRSRNMPRRSSIYPYLTLPTRHVAFRYCHSTLVSHLHTIYGSQKAKHNIAGKHVNSMVRKTRVWVLLENIQIELGYNTHSRIEALQGLLQSASRKDWHDPGSSAFPQVAQE